MAKKHKCPLVMIEWLDSIRPRAAWEHVSGIESEVARCVSVGWLLIDEKTHKGLAPNMAIVGDDRETMQAAGLITIPAASIVKITKLKEPGLTF